MGKIKEYIKKPQIIKTTYLISCIIFTIPSIVYIIQNKTVLQFSQYFKYFLNDSTSRTNQTIIYMLILAIITPMYIIIIKQRKKIFENKKKMFIFIMVTALIFVLVIPFVSSDIYYYLGIGKICSTYGQNPYYVTIKDYVEQGENIKLLERDTVLAQGYSNDWADSTVVYGPIWTIICQIIASITSNIDIALLIFKLVNVVVHIVNCYIIYKITNKKIWVLIYGLNPLVLIEGIVNVHNDIFVVLFTLLALYFLVKKKKLIISTLFLALATGIKYFTILLLPLMLIYYFKKEKPSKRFLKCIQYGIIFLAIFAIPYLLYIKDWSVFSGLFIQQEKIAKNFYLLILEYFKEPADLVKTINRLLFGAFAIIYAFYCIILLNKRNISLKEEMKKYQYFIIAFLFLLITNFQPWYILWLFPCIIWQSKKMVNWTIGISIITEFANSIFLAYGEAWPNGIPFTFIMLTGGLLLIIFEQRKEIKQKRKIILGGKS